MRAHLNNVLRLGGLPCISNPILNTLAANHTTTAAVAKLISSVTPTSHGGGGEVEAIRASIAKLLTNGVKLIATLKLEFGASPITGVEMYPSISRIMAGPSSDWASAI